MPVARLPSRSRSCPRDRYPVQIPVRSAGHPAPQPFPKLSRDQYPVQVPVRGAGCPAPQPFPESPPELVPVTRYPSEAPVARLLSRFRSRPQNWYLFSGYPSEVPVARLPGRSRSFLRERYPSLAVMNFYRLHLTRHKGFLAAISRFFSHPQDTRSYPPCPAVFPPSYPQIRPQTVEFPGSELARCWCCRALSCRRRCRWGRFRRPGIRRYREDRGTAAARCRPRSRPPRAPRR